jgi:hypothetical protein
MEHIIIWVVVGIAAYFLSKAVDRRRARGNRLTYLAAKYSDDTVAEALMAEKIWRGMTEEELRDSWGEPAAVDRPAPGAAASYTYARTGKKPSGGRVMLKDGVVVGWELT